MGARVHSFTRLNFRNRKVPVDAGSLLWQCAAEHASDYLSGNYHPSIKELQDIVLYWKNICQWDAELVFDGRPNPCKAPEDTRRKERRERARREEDGSLRAQVRNDEHYIALAIELCRFHGIRYKVAAYEADPQTVIALGEVPVTADADLIVFHPRRGKIVIVSSFIKESFRIIDIGADVTEGKYPLIDLFNECGDIVWRLYAACVGCDFTDHSSGIKGIGFDKYVSAVKNVDGDLSAESLAASLMELHAPLINGAGYATQDALACQLQQVVAAYTTKAHVYDDSANIRNMEGIMIQPASEDSRKHMRGDLNCKTLAPHSEEVKIDVGSINFATMALNTQADLSNIRGVRLPEGKTIDTMNCSELRDFLSARGGTVDLVLDEMKILAKQYQLMENEVPRKYFDRRRDLTSSLYRQIDTGVKVPIGSILEKLAADPSYNNEPDLKDLFRLTLDLHRRGEFDDSYSNIARFSPELPEAVIYRTFGKIGGSTEQKSIGDALSRCQSLNDAPYHALAMVPEQNKAVLLAKAVASMGKDEKTRRDTEDGNKPKWKEYLVILELEYQRTSEISDKHNLGRFNKLLRHICVGGCVAGRGLCRHKAEKMWFQFFHWTEERRGVERPPTLDACPWSPGGKPREDRVTAGLAALENKKMPRTLEEGKEKLERNAMRNCTEGLSAKHQPHVSSVKQKGSGGKRFSKGRPAVQEFWDSLRS